MFQALIDQKADAIIKTATSLIGKTALVGVYAGNFQLILPASSSLGAINAFMLTSFYQSNYVTARRIL